MIRTLTIAALALQVACASAQPATSPEAAFPGGTSLQTMFSFDEERNVLVAVGADGVAEDLGMLEHKVESSCAYHDGRRHHVFLPDGDGAIHHYLTDGVALLAVRTLYVNPDTEVCLTDPAGRWVYYLDPLTGIWRVPADAESEPVAEPVSLFEPWGTLAAGVETIDPAVAAGGAGAAAGHAAPAAEDRASAAGGSRAARDAAAEIVAAAETTPVRMAGDVADDPAIFVHPTDASMSLVLGSDKAEGLRVYALDGRERQFLPVGRLNNVDVRVVEAAGGYRAFAVASNRTHRRLDLFEIDLATGRVSAAGAWPVDLDDPYGICVAKTGPFDVFIGGTEGHVQRWSVEPGPDRIDASLRDEILFDSQTEGCAVDAAAGTLYVGEEDVGVWRVPIATPAERTLLIPASGDGLVPDVEGIALVESRDGERWLVVSSQGDDSFVLFDLAAQAIRLKFRIAMSFGSRIDGASETDGLDVTTAALPGFPEGLLVVQDGRNVAPAETQNFKLVGWGAVEALVR